MAGMDHSGGAAECVMVFGVIPAPVTGASSPGTTAGGPACDLPPSAFVSGLCQGPRQMPRLLGGRLLHAQPPEAGGSWARPEEEADSPAPGAELAPSGDLNIPGEE